LWGAAKQLKHSNDKTFTFCGTPQYTSPEIIMNRGHGLSSDNWSLGVLIYTLLEGANPFYFEGIDPKTLYHVIIKDNYCPLSEETSPDARSIVDGLLEKDPGKRLGAFRLKDVFSHPWFSDVNLKALRQKHVTAPWIPDAIELEE
jgi:serine/threonine protein kinase